jgi:hypothetical protein
MREKKPNAEAPKEPRIAEERRSSLFRFADPEILSWVIPLRICHLWYS